MQFGRQNRMQSVRRRSVLVMVVVLRARIVVTALRLAMVMVMMFHLHLHVGAGDRSGRPLLLLLLSAGRGRRRLLLRRAGALLLLLLLAGSQQGAAIIVGGIVLVHLVGELLRYGRDFGSVDVSVVVCSGVVAAAVRRVGASIEAGLLATQRARLAAGADASSRCSSSSSIELRSFSAGGRRRCGSICWVRRAAGQRLL